MALTASIFTQVPGGQGGNKSTFESVFSGGDSSTLVDPLSGEPQKPSMKLRGVGSSMADAGRLNMLKPPKTVVEHENMFGKPGRQSTFGIRQTGIAQKLQERQNDVGQSLSSLQRPDQSPFGNTFSTHGAESTKRRHDFTRFFPRNETQNRQPTEEFKQLGAAVQPTSGGVRGSLGEVRNSANFDVSENFRRGPFADRVPGGGKQSSLEAIEMPERMQSVTQTSYTPMAFQAAQAPKQRTSDVGATMREPRTDMFSKVGQAFGAQRGGFVGAKPNLHETLKDFSAEHQRASGGYRTEQGSYETAPRDVRPPTQADLMEQRSNFAAAPTGTVDAGYAPVQTPRHTLRETSDELHQAATGPGALSSSALRVPVEVQDTIRSIMQESGSLPTMGPASQVVGDYASAPQESDGIPTQRGTEMLSQRAPASAHKGVQGQMPIELAQTLRDVLPWASNAAPQLERQGAQRTDAEVYAYGRRDDLSGAVREASGVARAHAGALQTPAVEVSVARDGTQELGSVTGPAAYAKQPMQAPAEAPVTMRQQSDVAARAPQAAYDTVGAAYQSAPTDELRGARHLDEGKPWVPGPSRSYEGEDTGQGAAHTASVPELRGVQGRSGAPGSWTKGRQMAKGAEDPKMQAFLTQARMQAPTDGTQGVQAATSYEDLAEHALRDLPQQHHANPAMRDSGSSARTNPVELLRTDREDVENITGAMRPPSASDRSTPDRAHLGSPSVDAYIDPADAEVASRFDPSTYDGVRSNPFVVQPLFEKLSGPSSRASSRLSMRSDE